MNFLLSETPLFFGGTEVEAKAMLHCLGSYEKKYEKGEYIYHSGDMVTHMGLVLSGGVLIEHNDMWGNKSILRQGGAGHIFAETYAGVADQPMLVSVVATEDTQILFLDASKVMTTCPTACPHHTRLIRNVLQILIERNLELSQKILHTSSRSIRGRLLSYLSEQVTRQGGYQISIPFNRQQLADYLGVDRSAMSAELSKMGRDGLISYRKNRFTIHQSLE